MSRALDLLARAIWYSVLTVSLALCVAVFARLAWYEPRQFLALVAATAVVIWAARRA